MLANTVTTSHRWPRRLEVHQVKNPLLGYTGRISRAQRPRVAGGCWSEQAGGGRFRLLDGAAGELSWLSKSQPQRCWPDLCLPGQRTGLGRADWAPARSLLPMTFPCREEGLAASPGEAASPDPTGWDEGNQPHFLSPSPPQLRVPSWLGPLLHHPTPPIPGPCPLAVLEVSASCSPSHCCLLLTF